MLTQALEVLRGAGEEELVLLGCGCGALGDARLDEVGLDPLAEPLEVAVAVEGVGAQGEVGDGAPVLKGVLRNHGDVVAVQRQNPEVL